MEKVGNSRAAVSRWQRCRVLVVEEISMLGAELFDVLNTIAKTVRGSRLPFGGVSTRVLYSYLVLVLEENEDGLRWSCT